jgi:hypothetical protein
MAKIGCAKCGGTKKMAKGGTTKSVSISKPGAGVVKETKGNTNQKMGIYGIAQTGPTGPNNSGIVTMKKGGAVKKPLVKAQTGKTVKSKTPFQNYMKTPGAVASDTITKRDDINTLKKAPNKPGLDAAYRKTYGDDYVGRQSDGIYTMSKKDADAQDRRMGPSRKMGGATKKLTKAKVGGVVKSKKK